MNIFWLKSGGAKAPPPAPPAPPSLLKSVIPNFVACLVFHGMAFSFIKLISSSDTLTKREAAILEIYPPAVVTSAEVISNGNRTEWRPIRLGNHTVFLVQFGINLHL